MHRGIYPVLHLASGTDAIYQILGNKTLQSARLRIIQRNCGWSYIGLYNMGLYNIGDFYKVMTSVNTDGAKSVLFPCCRH